MSCGTGGSCVVCDAPGDEGRRALASPPRVIFATVLWVSQNALALLGRFHRDDARGVGIVGAPLAAARAVPGRGGCSWSVGAEAEGASGGRFIGDEEPG